LLFEMLYIFGAGNKIWRTDLKRWRQSTRYLASEYTRC
jgi:hypothetical protein